MSPLSNVQMVGSRLTPAQRAEGERFIRQIRCNIIGSWKSAFILLGGYFVVWGISYLAPTTVTGAFAVVWTVLALPALLLWSAHLATERPRVERRAMSEMDHYSVMILVELLADTLRSESGTLSDEQLAWCSRISQIVPTCTGVDDLDITGRKHLVSLLEDMSWRRFSAPEVIQFGVDAAMYLARSTLDARLDAKVRRIAQRNYLWPFGMTVSTTLREHLSANSASR